jgi:hypothetical protein
VLQRSSPTVEASAIVRGHGPAMHLELLFLSFFLSTSIRALTRVPVIETAPVSRHHMDPSCALSALDLVATWSFVCFLLMCWLGMNPNPSVPIVFYRAYAGGRDAARCSTLLPFPPVPL